MLALYGIQLSYVPEGYRTSLSSHTNSLDDDPYTAGSDRNHSLVDRLVINYNTPGTPCNLQ